MALQTNVRMRRALQRLCSIRLMAMVLFFPSYVLGITLLILAMGLRQEAHQEEHLVAPEQPCEDSQTV